MDSFHVPRQAFDNIFSSCYSFTISQLTLTILGKSDIMTGEHGKTQEKRTRMRGEERREFILNRAKEVFARYGYADASTGELARASEVTEPMRYKHFWSKKGLFLAVVSEFSV